MAVLALTKMWVTELVPSFLNGRDIVVYELLFTGCSSVATVQALLQVGDAE